MNVAALPDAIPKKGNAFTRWLGRFVLWLMGWKIEGAFPNEPKLVIIIAPHTSNWDFIVGIASRLALGLSAHWLGKHTIFVWPLAPLLRRLGGIPVDRASARGTVDQVAEMFHQREKLILGLSPEGTRKRVDKWKTGFYYIALQAGVPIVPVSLDYGQKILGIGTKMVPTGDSSADLNALAAYYAGVRARHPDQFALPSMLA